MSEPKISFDALLAMGLIEAANRELEGLPTLEELNRDYPPSSEFEEKMRRLIAREERSKRLHVYKRRLKHLASAAVAALALTTCVFAPVDAVQEAVVSTVIEWKDEYVSVL